MDDDLETFQEVTDRDLGAGPSDSMLSPIASRLGSQEDARSVPQRLRKAAAVLILGQHNDVKYAGRDRLAILLRGGLGVVGIAALLAALADAIGIQSGPFWEFQVFVDRLLLQSFAFIGDVGMKLANAPLLTLLVVLALIGLGVRRW
jgi:hypothetical protein